MSSVGQSSLFLVRSRVAAVFQRRATWVLIDQAVVSLGNFLTGNALGRTLPESEYGVFGLLLETMLYLNSLQAALIIYPLTIRGAMGNQKGLGRLATASCVFTLALLPLLGAATWFALRAMNALSLTAVAIVALLLWQVQETLRRGLISDLRMKESVWSDAVRYLGQAGIIIALAMMHMLTLPTAMLVMALTAAASIAVQARQIGLEWVKSSDLAAIVKDFWHLGRWMILCNAGGLISTLGYWWTLRGTHGLAACGAFNAIMQMFKLANPIMNGMTGLIVPAVARAAVSDTPEAVRRVALRYIGLGSALIMPYFLMLAVFPTWTLSLFYRSDSPYADYAMELQLFVANFTCVYFSSVINAWLSGLGHSRWNFFVQVWCIVVTLAIGLPLTAMWGLMGVTIGGLVTSLTGVAAASWFIHRAHR